MEAFIGDLPEDTKVERTLATLLVARLDEPAAGPPGSGDEEACNHRQRDRILRHALAQYRGDEVELSDMRCVATFDGPARALKCALTIVDELGRFDLPVRIGVHTGELQVGHSGISGMALDIASGIAELAPCSDVVASRTVKDLVAGSGIGFQEFCERSFAGLAEPWRLFRVRDTQVSDPP